MVFYLPSDETASVADEEERDIAGVTICFKPEPSQSSSHIHLHLKEAVHTSSSDGQSTISAWY